MVKIIQARQPRFVTLCGRIFHNTDPQYFPRAEYRGRTIYFCTESCLGAFMADPDLFYKAHRNSEKRQWLRSLKVGRLKVRAFESTHL